MSRGLRYAKLWWLQLVVAAVTVWVGHGFFFNTGSISKVTYAQAETRPILIERPPVRFIKDPHPAFSTVAVNSENNMLVVGDENLFQILEFDRRDNTPPQARLTEPKRTIGGPATFFEMMCGVYIDPKTRDIYVINGDTQNWMPVFGTDARGNAKPKRVLEIPGHPFQLTADEEQELIYMVIPSR